MYISTFRIFHLGLKEGVLQHVLYDKMARPVTT